MADRDSTRKVQNMTVGNELPAGRTCGDCRHFARCQWLISQPSDSVECDWTPSRFERDGKATTWFQKPEESTHVD